MGEVKHTPGPWWIAGKGTVRYGNPNSIDTGWIASVYWRNREANVPVIAAAPDMLAALRAMVARMELYAGPDGIHAGEQDKALLIQANAAIAAAEGR